MSLQLLDIPDPSAPSTPRSPWAFLTRLHSKIAFFTFLPYTILQTTFFHYTSAYPSWQSYTTSLLMQVIRLFLWSEYVLHLPGPHGAEWEVPKALTPLGKKARIGMKSERVVLEPVDDTLAGAMGEIKGVKPVQRPGWMIEREDGVGNSLRPAGKGEKVVLYLHSGAYIIGHPLEPGFAWDMSRELNLRVFGVNYRKTLDAQTAHPGPVWDALSGYLYLVNTLHFFPEDIILIGDSAGGHLSLMLTRYLHTVNLPLPGLIALSSPWCDFTASASRPNFPSQVENYRTDYVPYLGHLAIPSGTRYYTRESLRSVWFSPALASPGDWAFLKEEDVKVYIMRGTKELLAGEVEAVALGMKNDAVEVYLRDDIDGAHVGPTMRWKGSTAWKVWIRDVKEMINQGKVDVHSP